MLVSQDDCKTKIGNKLIFKKPKIFYGWYIVIGLGTVGMVSVGLGGLNFGLFIHPIHQDLHINHTFFGFTQTARLVGFAISSWLIGRILDEYGARIPMAIAGILLCTIMICLSLVQTGWQLVILFFIQGMIGMEGAGGNLFQSVPLSRWFVRKRGKAMSLTFLGTTAGMFAFTPLIQYIIIIASWRYAWLIVGCSSCLVIIIVALVIIRKDPESMGLQPDGDSVESEGYESRKINPSLSEYPWTRSQAIRTFSFWALIAIMGLRMFSMGTVNIFRIPYYIDQGISAQFVAWAISAEAVVSALVSVPTGWAVDRFQPRYVAAVSLVSFIAVIVVTMYVTTTWHVFVATTLFGVSAASFIVSQNALWPNYFGGRHIGSIRGFAIPLTLFFSAIGAPIAGRIKDVTGSYISAWLISIVCLSIATVLMLMARKPKPPVE